MRSKLVSHLYLWSLKPPFQISVETVIAGRWGTRPFGSTRPFLDVVGPMESGKKRLLMLRIHRREIIKATRKLGRQDTLLNAICPAIYIYLVTLEDILGSILSRKVVKGRES